MHAWYINVVCVSSLISMPPSADTLIWGTANPEGLADTYNGIYLNASDIKDVVDQIDQCNRRGESIPVHVEHTGIPMGRVVSAWEHNGRLECVLSLDNKVFEGTLGTELVCNGMCKDLSLGYTVDLANSKTRGFDVKRKFIKEISIVKKGARKNCHIHGVSKPGAR